MTNKDVIPRLRLRMHQAQSEGRDNEAGDLRLALETLIRLDRDVQVTRPIQSRLKISA
jgi:hypothetical protein